MNALVIFSARGRVAAPAGVFSTRRGQGSQVHHRRVDRRGEILCALSACGPNYSLFDAGDGWQAAARNDGWSI